MGELWSFLGSNLDPMLIDYLTLLRLSSSFVNETSHTDLS